MADTPKLKLTDKQEAFAIEYTLNNGNASAAYRKCYDSKTDSDGSIWVQAHKVLQNSNVSIRVKELRKQKFSNKILSIKERKKILSELSINGDTKALDILNKMDGLYIEKKQVEHSGTIVQRTINVNPTKGTKDET